MHDAMALMADRRWVGTYEKPQVASPFVLSDAHLSMLLSTDLRPQQSPGPVAIVLVALEGNGQYCSVAAVRCLDVSGVFNTVMEKLRGLSSGLIGLCIQGRSASQHYSCL